MVINKVLILICRVEYLLVYKLGIFCIKCLDEVVFCDNGLCGNCYC